MRRRSEEDTYYQGDETAATQLCLPLDSGMHAPIVVDTLLVESRYVHNTSACGHHLPAEAERPHAITQGDAVAPHSIHVRPERGKEDAARCIPQKHDAHDDRQRCLVVQRWSHLRYIGRTERGGGEGS